jgi:ribosomal-protein-alanine N-acetyltransferase
MDKNKLSVREIQTSDIEHVIQYWLGSDHNYLEGMGVDVKKLPAREQLNGLLMKQINSL